MYFVEDLTRISASFRCLTWDGSVCTLHTNNNLYPILEKSTGQLLEVGLEIEKKVLKICF